MVKVRIAIDSSERSGQDNGWDWVKYSDGTYEAWRDYNHDSLVSRSGGTVALCRTDGFSAPSIPSGLTGVKITPTLKSAVISDTAWLSFYGTGMYIVTRVAGTVTDIIVHYDLTGRWK